MNRLLLLSLLLPCFCLAQQDLPVHQGNRQAVRLAVPGKAVPEQVGPAILSDTCANRVFLYQTSGNEDEGFVFGTNQFTDLAKIQRIIFPSDSGFVVTSVDIAFAVADAEIADRSVSVRIYNDISADSTIGALLATSESVLVGDIALPTPSTIEFTTFTFPNPPVVTRDSFWVFVNLSDIYEAESGDVGIWHTDDGCGDGQNVFEQYSNERFGVLSARWSSPDGPLNAEMVIFATVDTDLSVSTRTPLVDYSAAAVPNPASDRFQLRFTPTSPGLYRASLTDLRGRQLRTTAPRHFGSEATIDWSLGDLPAGLYLYHVDGPDGRQSGKVIKR